MSSTPAGSPLPPRPRSAFHTAAQASWVAFLAFLGVGMFGKAALPPLLHDVLSIVIVLVGFVLALFAFAGLRRHGRKGILAPALVGFCLNGLFLLIALTNASAAAQRARERRGQPAPSAPTARPSTESKSAT